MQVTRGYKTELDLNNEQITACLKHAGAARWAYNWGLSRYEAEYKAGRKTPNAQSLHRELNALKQTDLPWMYEVSKCAPQEALRDLEKAFKHFFRKVALKKQGKWKRKCGYPKFKSKKKGIGSFRLTGAIHVDEGHVQLPRLGKLRLKEKGYIPVIGVKILSATVSEQAGRWFVSVQVEEEQPKPTLAPGHTIGVDLGVKVLATLSDARVVENPKALRSNLKKLRRLSRRHSRKQKGSKNRAKATRKLAYCQYPSRYAAQGDIVDHSENQARSRTSLLHRDGGSECKWDAQKPQACTCDSRCGFLRAPKTDRVQGDACRFSCLYRVSVGAVK